MLNSSPDDTSNPESEAPLRLMSREEFERRFKDVQREENRYALIMLAFFVPAFGGLCAVGLAQGWRINNEPAWIQIAILLLFFATMAGIFGAPLWLAERYFRRRPQRFGFVCPNCGVPLRGFPGLVRVSYFQCPSCDRLLSVD